MPCVRPVLDTNVVVSALLKDGGREALIFDLAASGAFVPVLSGPLLEVYVEVLGRPGFGFDADRVRVALNGIQRHALHVGFPKAAAGAASDPDDGMVLACAVAGVAHYVVTGNVRHFPAHSQGIKTIPPRRFLVVLAAGAE